MRISKFLKLAREQAILSELKDKHGAVITQKNIILSVGKNLPKTHPKQREYNQYQDKDPNLMHHYIHAEFNALNKIPKHIDLSGATLHVYKIKKDGTCSNSKPCPGCMQAIYDRKIKKIIYSTKDGFEEIDIDYSIIQKNKKIHKIK